MSGSFNPNDIPDQSGRVFFVTGGTAGLGALSLSLIARKSPAHIIFSGRNEKRGQEIVAKLKAETPNTRVTFIRCDLADLDSVKQAADTLLSKTNRLDVFYANAGIMGLTPGLTKDGYELQFGTNHVGHAYLTKLLLPILLKTAEQPNSDVRIINMSSDAYRQAPKQGIVFESLKTTQDGLGGMIPGPRWSRYGQSKLANMLYAQELARRYPSIKTVSVHPGYIKTDLFHGLPFLVTLPLRFLVPLTIPGSWTPVEQGPYNQTWAGTTARSNLVDGAYYEPIAKKATLATAQSKDDKLAEKLWDWTEKELAGRV